MSIVTEIVHMKTKESIPKDGFIKIVDALERGFHSKQSGFLDAELLYNEKAETWIMIQHWESLEQMKAASANMFKDSVTEAFREAIEPKAVSIGVFPVLGNWSVAETGE